MDPLAIALIEKWGLFLLLAVILLFVFVRPRSFSRRSSTQKMSFRKGKIPYAVAILLEKNRYFSPSLVAMTTVNIGNKDIDLRAPVIVFKRWFTTRRFQIRRVEHQDIYPLWLERGKQYTIDISLEQFYRQIPELQLACRMQIEMTDQRGKRFRSGTIRLKWF